LPWQAYSISIGSAKVTLLVSNGFMFVFSMGTFQTTIL